MGGRSGRATPQWRPLRIVFLKISNVQMPVPVLTSGERFAAKLTPQGPENAVFVGAVATAQRSDFSRESCAGEVIGICCGWPDSMRVRSGPIFPSGCWIHGVWQSLQPPIVTKYAPRATCCARVMRTGCGSGGAGRDAFEATITASEAATIMLRNNQVFRFIVSSVVVSEHKVGM